MDTLSYSQPVAAQSETVRGSFIRKTYIHLALALLAFLALEAFLLQTPLAATASRVMTEGYAWLVVLAVFMGVSWIADRWAHSTESVGTQYLGLSIFVIAEAVIFLPLLYVATSVAPSVLPTAGLLTALLFAGLTLVAFTTKADFSFLRGALMVGGFVALGIIAASILFGFTLGLVFSGAMILFASAAILYSTGNIVHEYGAHQHVAASLSLFASVALLFWYIVQFLMSWGGEE